MKSNHRGFDLAIWLRGKITLLILLSATCFIVVPLHAKDSASFAGIQIGMQAESLPAELRPDEIKMTYRGIVGGDYLEVSVSNGKVTGFQVTYLGKNLNLDLISKPITLRQAVARHSAGTPDKPVFAKSVSRSGAPTGLADTANIIAYYTGGSTSPDAQVQYVYYANPDAPFANVRKSQLLSASEAIELQRVETDKTAIESAQVKVASADEYLKASTRQGAVKTMQILADDTLGTGRRVDALIDKAEIWLGVDPRHPEAKQTFCDLLSYSVRFNNNFKSLATAYAANESLLSASDIEVLVEPTQIKKALDRRMRQVTAMGYDGALCVLL